MVRGKPAPALTAVLAAAAAVATGPRHATGQPNYAEHSLAGAPDYGQCGGNDYAGPTTCAHEDSGTTCVYANDWYSQCIPPEGGGSGGGNVFYNLQLYAWRIESGSFQDHTCGNRWLEFYNSCGNSGYFPGGIGSCGSWGSTVDRMTQCGADNAAVAAEVRAEFCSCLQCVFVPAATRTDHPFVYLNDVCHDSQPFEVAVLALADGVCGSPTCVDSAMEDDALTSSSPSTSISTVVSTTLESDTATTTTTGSAPSATTSTTPGSPAMASTPEDRSTPLSSGTASTRAESTTMAQATTARADPSLSSSPPSTAVPTGPGVADWGQCGGSGYSGPTTCAHEDTGTACVYHHEWYSQCVPAHGSGGSDHVFYNLQLYAWRVESKYFADNMCGNRWLDFYNACGNAGYFPGGIGFCGRWGSTVDRMTQCGVDEVVDAGVQAAFCECLQCTFVPAATSAAHPYAYLDAHAHCGDVPAFEEAVLALADDVCGSRTCGSAADPDEATVHPDATAAVPVTVTGRGGGLTAAPLVTTAPPTTTATTHAPGGGVESTQGRLWGDSLFYNLQLYAWRVESRFFEDNTCGNRWLDFYNACFDGGYFPSGIGFCGKWGATVGLLEQCGAEDGNGTVTQTVHDHFCHCLQCTFVPAATSTEYPYEYLDPQTCSGVPTFEDAVLQLVDSVCETRACSGSGSSRAASAGLATALVVMGAAVSGALRGGWP